MEEAYDKLKILHKNHWTHENFCQRMPTKDWKLVLLNCDDRITFHGHMRKLVGKKMGYGIVEVSKQALQGKAEEVKNERRKSD